MPLGRGGPGGWWIIDEPELHVGGHVLVPDLAGWRREHLPRLPDTAWFETAPDWVCEILSPATARNDATEKLRIHASIGVQHIWLGDPDQRTLEAYENRQNLWQLLQTCADDAHVAVAPFDTVGWQLGVLWVD